MIIKNKAVNLSTIFFIIYLLILPIFGKVIDSREAVVFYGLAPFLFLNIFFFKTKNRPYPTLIHLLLQSSLIFLFFISTAFSVNIGLSVYPLLKFIAIILVFNLYPFYLDNLNLLYKFIIGFACLYSTLLLASVTHLIALPLAIHSDNFILQVWGHSYLADFLIFPILILLSKINLKNYKLSLPLLIFLSISLVLTNSRSALVATIVGILLLSIKNKLFVWLKIIFLVTLTVLLINIFNFSRPSPQNSIKSLDGSRLEYWHEAIIGFTNSPIIGNGASSFDFFNRQNRPSGLTSSIYASNSFLQLLSDHGLIFTIIFFLFIFSGLYYQFKTNNLLSCLGLAALVNSLLDPSWTSSGILILSLIFIFYHHPLFFPNPKGAKKLSLLFLSLLSIILFICFIADTVSTYLYSQKSYDLSLKFNPFNFNSHIATINYHREYTIKLFKNFGNTYIALISQTPLPQSEQYYYKLFNLNPRQGLPYYYNLFNYYYYNRLSNKFDNLAVLMNKNINLNDWNIDNTMPHAKIIYRQAIFEWKSGQKDQAINNLKIALHFSHDWSHFYIELANAYWHNNQQDLAVKLLEIDCAQNTQSAPNCLDYLNKNRDNFLLPGTDSMQQSINAILN